jgi:hypothetical protein
LKSHLGQKNLQAGYRLQETLLILPFCFSENPAHKKTQELIESE